MDVRRINLRPGESIRSYRVPSSLFLMSIRGNATVNLGREIHRLQRFTVLHAVLHAGKGGQPIYTGLGFKPPADIAAEMAEPGWASFSAEVLPKYAGDYIILTSDSKTLDEVKADPIWGALPAVQNDHVFVWTSDRSGYWDPIAILSQTEELAAWLTSP